MLTLRTKFPEPRDGARADFYAFYWAAQAIRDGEDPYAPRPKLYIYPPATAVALVPLAGLDGLTASRIWFVANAALAGVLVWLVFAEVRRRLALPTDHATAAGVMGLAVICTWDPLRRVLADGQTDLYVALSWILALRWLERRPALAGLALAVGANIKFVTIVALPYLLVRARWRTAAAFAGGFVAVALLPALVLGWDANLTGLARSAGGVAGLVGQTAGAADPGERLELGVHPLSWIHSISIPSGLARSLGDASGTRAAVLALTAGIGALTVGVCAWLYRRNGRRLFKAAQAPEATAPGSVVLLEWCGVLAALLALGPQTMKRHLALLVLANTVCAALLVPVDAGRPVQRRVQVLALGALLLLQAGLHLPPRADALRALEELVNRLGFTGWTVLVSFLLLLAAGLARARPAGPAHAS